MGLAGSEDSSEERVSEEEAVEAALLLPVHLHPSLFTCTGPLGAAPCAASFPPASLCSPCFSSLVNRF